MNLESKQKQKRFHAVVSAIDKIAQEEIVCCGAIAANL